MNQFISQRCSKYLTTDNLQSFNESGKLSGWGINKLGNYQQCINNDSYAYFLFRIILNETNQIVSGLCFTQACSQKDLQYILSSMQIYGGLPLSNIDVTNPNSSNATFPVIFYICISLIFSLLLIVIIMTALKYFNVYNNKLIDCLTLQKSFIIISKKQEKYKILRSLRFLAFIFTVFFHQLTLILNTSPAIVATSSISFVNTFFIVGYSSDIWLFISGCLLFMIVVEKKQKYGTHKSYLIVVVKHIALVYIFYIVGLFITWSILPYIGTGPLYPSMRQKINSNCFTNIIPTIFMLHNFDSHLCNPWLWYYQCEVQLTIVFTIWMYFYLKKNPIINKILYGLQFIIFCTAILSPLFHDHEQTTLINYIITYEKGWDSLILTRAIPFMLGLNTTALFIENSKQIQRKQYHILDFFRNQVVLLLTFIIPILGFIGIQYYLYSRSSNILENYDFIFLKFIHALIPLLVLIFIVRSMLKFRSRITSFLTMKAFVVLSRFTHSCFVLHYVIIVWKLFIQTTDIYMNELTLVFVCICNFPIILLTGFIFSLIFEIPLKSTKHIMFTKFSFIEIDGQLSES